MAASRVARRALIALLIVIFLGLITGFFWLRTLGAFLVHSEQPVKADVILVLGGDWTGERILTAAQLAKEGYAPRVWVSGPMEIYGVNEAALAIDFAVSRGFPRTLFDAKLIPSSSTRTEAIAFHREFERANIHNVLLVTSNFHTRRVRSVYHQVLDGNYHVNVVSAPYRYYHPEDWWKRREDRKTWFFEISKTAGEFLGL